MNHLQEKITKYDTYETTYTMKIPIIENSDNFRMDKIIDDYKNKINIIAKNIIPERKETKPEPLSKNPDILAKLKYKKENKNKLFKINDAIIDKIYNNPIDNHGHKTLINRLAKGDSKFMSGIPQLKTKEGFSLNSPVNKNKLARHKNEAVLELRKIDDSFENKIKYETEKDKDKDKYRNNLKNSINSEIKEHIFSSGDDASKNTNSKRHSKKDSLFLTGVEKKVDFNLFDNNINTYNSLTRLKDKKSQDPFESNKSLFKILVNEKKDLKNDTKHSINSVINNSNINNNQNAYNSANNNHKIDYFSSSSENKQGNVMSIFSKLKNNSKNNKDKEFNSISNHNSQYHHSNFLINPINEYEDSDLISDEEQYKSVIWKIPTNSKLRSISSNMKDYAAKNFIMSNQNYKYNYNNFLSINNMINDAKNYLANPNNDLRNYHQNLDKLKEKNEFFKTTLRTRSLKNLQDPKNSNKEKKFHKENYFNTMRNFVEAVNTEVNFYTQTFSDIEKGIKNFDFIKSVHIDIPHDKILDKKMVFTEKFARKYFIYGNHGGQFISEDKENDDIIERSDNLAKITPEISFKFKKLIMDRFSEKQIVNFSNFIEPNSYKANNIIQNSKKVAQLIDNTDKLRARVDNDLTNFIIKSNEEKNFHKNSLE